MEKNANCLQGRLDLDGMDTGTSLHEYGIYEEQSDIRAHVACNKTVYVFKTQECLNTLGCFEFKKVPAYQPGYDKPTAYGYLVPPKHINDIRELKYYSWNKWSEFSENWATTEKGVFAVECVISLLNKGRFPLWINAEQTQDYKIDIEGTDILIVMNMRIQVKCDWPAGKTGNLFIQTHEKNPFKRY